ncbi:MAG: ABC transporter substrate-binding protein [Chloroflexi bacterium]|nr:ABC transporter substrate-binding protein [Chloroflexota bacterium]
MKRLALFLFATLALGLAACGGDDDGGLTKVTVMLDWTPNTHHSGIYLAKEKGWYRDAGLDVTIVEPAAGGVEAVVAAGKADFGVSIQEAVIPARAEGVPIVSIAAIKQHNDSSLIALKGEGITRPKDLAGKTYGGFGGALETALIRQLVKCDGGDPEKVKFVEVGNIDYLAGMEANQFDFVWVFEGWDAIRYNQVENKPVSSIKFTDYLNCIPDWYTPLLITSEKMLKDHPDTVRKFLEATTRGYDEAIKNPDAAAAALLKGAPELDEKLVKLSQAYHTTKYMDSGRRWGLQDANIWVNFEKFLRDAKLTDKQVDVSKAYTNDYLPKP